MKNFKLPEIEDEYDRKVLSDVSEFGFHIIGIEKDEEGPAFSFTIGLYYTFNHPEILIMGLRPEICCEFFHSITEKIKQGSKFIDGVIDSELSSFSTHFKAIELEYYKEYLGYAAWFYQSLPEPFPAVQFIWPDRNGVFPWEKGYDKSFFNLQRVLSE